MYDQRGFYWDLPWYVDTYHWFMSNPFFTMLILTVILCFSTLLFVTRKVQ